MIRHPDPRRGATAVEFAALLPLLVVLMLATIDLARLSFGQVMLQFAVQDAGRRVTADPDADAARIKTWVNDYALIPSSNPVTVAVNENTAHGLTFKIIKAQFDFDWVVPLGVLGGNLGTVTITARNRVPIEEN